MLFYFISQSCLGILSHMIKVVCTQISYTIAYIFFPQLQFSLLMYFNTAALHKSHLQQEGISVEFFSILFERCLQVILEDAVC